MGFCIQGADSSHRGRVFLLLTCPLWPAGGSAFHTSACLKRAPCAGAAGLNCSVLSSHLFQDRTRKHTHTRVLSVACEFRLLLLIQMEHLQGFLLTSLTQ